MTLVIGDQTLASGATTISLYLLGDASSALDGQVNTVLQAASSLTMLPPPAKSPRTPTVARVAPGFSCSDTVVIIGTST